MFISGTYFSDNHWFSLLYGNFRFSVCFGAQPYCVQVDK